MEPTPGFFSMQYFLVVSRCAERIERFLEDRPPPPSPVSKFDGRHTGRLREKRGNLLPGVGVRGCVGVQGTESHDC
jgi:hypothetical protein